MMRKFLLSSAAVVALSASALAADLPVHMAPPPPPPPPVFTWAGVYLGATLGYAAGFHNFQENSDPYGINGRGGLFNQSGQHQSGGVAGGPEIGVNFQTGSFVYGLEADVNWTTAKLNNNNSYPYPYNNSSFYSSYTDTYFNNSTDRLNYLGTVRGRIGLAFDRTLIYFTGGLAYGNVHNSRSYGENYSYTYVGGSYYDYTDSVYNSSTTKIGWVVGGGVEYALTPNWTIKGEALYAGLGNSTVPVAFAEYYPGSGSSIIVDRSTGVFSNNVLLIRAGVNYKFDWFAPPVPVVAKY